MFKSCIYDDNETIRVELPNGNKVSILCNLVEEELFTTIATQPKLDWLKDNEPSTYAELYLSGRMQEFLNNYQKSYAKQESIIKNQLSKTFYESTASMIAREFMMYDS